MLRSTHSTRFARVFRTLVLTLTLALCASLASAKVVYVNQNAPGPAHDGKTWATAFLKVQEGANVAVYDDEIWVAKGSYPENIAVTEAVSLLGGFRGDETSADQRDIRANATELAPNEVSPDVPAVRFSSILWRVTEMDGFTVRPRAISGQWSKTLVSDGVLSFTRNIVVGDVFLGRSSFFDHSIVADNVVEGVLSALTGFTTVTRNTVRGPNARLVVLNNGQPVTDNLIVRTSRQDDSLLLYRYWHYSDDVVNALVANNTLVNPGTTGTTMEVSGGHVANNIVVGGNVGIDVRDTSMAVAPPVDNCIWGYSGGTAMLVDGLPRQSGYFALDPRFVDPAGSDYRILPDSPCLDAGDDSVRQPDDTDVDGGRRRRGNHVDIGAYESADPSYSFSLGAPLLDSPVVFIGNVYATTSDGKLHARTLADGSAVPGFPVDLAAALGSPVTFNSRTAVYAGATGQAIYLTTEQGHVVKVSPQGKVLWQIRPLPGFTRSTPAVTPDGKVLVNLGWDLGLGSAANFVFSLDERTGRALAPSVYLGAATPASRTDRSPAVDAKYVYINASGEGRGGLVALHRDNLMLRAQCAYGEDALPPYLSGADVFLATRNGNLYRRSRVALAPVEGFGTRGRVAFGTELTTSPFADAAGTLYVGTATGQVYAVDPKAGAKRLFHDSGTGQPVVGLVVDRTSGVVAFGSGNRLVQVLASEPRRVLGQALDGSIVGGIVYHAASGRFIVATAPGTIHAVPAM